MQTVTGDYYKHWQWYNETEDIEGHKVYGYIDNNSMDIYSGQTINLLADRLANCIDKPLIGPCAVLNSREFCATIFGIVTGKYLNEQSQRDILAIFEQVFIHIMTRLPQLVCRNKEIPFVYE